MPINIVRLAFREDMNLMRSLVSALSQIPSSGQPPFSKVLITNSFKRSLFCIDPFQIAYDRHNINNWFRCKSWYGCTANVIYSYAVFSQNVPHKNGFFLKCMYPLWIVFHYYNMLRHLFNSPN